MLDSRKHSKKAEVEAFMSIFHPEIYADKDKMHKILDNVKED